MSSSNIYSTVTNINIRRLVTFYFLPGFILIAGQLFIFRDYLVREEEFNNIVQSSQIITLFVITYITVSLIIGYLIEDLGSKWEMTYCAAKSVKRIRDDVDGVNAIVKHENPSLNESQVFAFAWERFLALSYNADNSTGHRFLRYMLERLKFELNTGFSFYILFFASLLKWVYLLINAQNPFNIIEISFVFGCFILTRFLLVKESVATSKALHETRLIIVVENDENWKDYIKMFNMYTNALETRNVNSIESTKFISVFNRIASNLSKVRRSIFLLSLLLLNEMWDLWKRPKD